METEVKSIEVKYTWLEVRIPEYLEAECLIAIQQILAKYNEMDTTYEV
jgi:hypothetical protein